MLEVIVGKSKNYNFVVLRGREVKRNDITTVKVISMKLQLTLTSDNLHSFEHILDNIREWIAVTENMRILLPQLKAVPEQTLGFFLPTSADFQISRQQNFIWCGKQTVETTIEPTKTLD